MSARRARSTPTRALLGLLRACLSAALLVCLLGLVGVPGAGAQAPPTTAWWSLNATSAPTLLPHGGEAQILVTASNLGDATIQASSDSPATLTDTLPAGVQPVAYATRNNGRGFSGCVIEGQTVSCHVTGPVAPYDAASADIVVQTDEPQGPLVNIVRIAGAGVPSPAPFQQTLQLQAAAGERTPFGVEAFSLSPEDQEGNTDALAGSHPFQLTSTLDLNQRLEPSQNPEFPGAGKHPGETGGSWPSSAALPRDLHFMLPPGLLGDPTALPRCSDQQFKVLAPGATNRCPPDTAVGVASFMLFDPGPLLLFGGDVPVFNLQPAPGEPARFGFIVERVPIILTTAVNAGGEYQVQVNVDDISQVVSILQTQVTLWGNPGDERHDASRGWECLQAEREESPCQAPPAQSDSAFLTMPTSCEASLQPTVSGSSWQAGAGYPEQTLTATPASTPFPTMTGCEGLSFEPAFTYTPESLFASTPSGITGTLTIPQTGLLEGEGRAPSALRETRVDVPEGVQVNPAAASGLGVCTEAQVGYTGENQASGIFEFTPAQPECASSSKVASVTIRTPLLAEPVTGGIYLAEPAPNSEAGKNPFDSLIAAWFIAQAPQSGILVKLAGYAQLNQTTGQITLIFPGTPQVPFEELKAAFLGGPRASTATPAFCGAYTFHTQYAGWSGLLSEPLASPAFPITAGPEGSACPQGHLPFSPSFTAGPESPQAGALTPLLVKIGHPDGDQPLTGISVTEPPGFAAVLASVTPCQEPPPGVEWSCGEDSRIGEAREYSGLGPEPVVVTGQAYLTSGYDGAPFGLLVRTLAKAGPFDLGYVNVRSRINVNPSTAQVTVTTDPGPRGESIPTLLKGVPVQLKALEVAINRPGFTFNPTSCEPLTTTATLSGSEGTAANVSAPFKAEGCASLPFHPTLEASTAGQASKADGASLDVKVTSQGLGVANIQKVFLTIPKILPSRLQPTLQHACLAAVFEANPAACDEDSLIGYATVRTPVLKSPLTGPAYVVSHGGAAFPDVEFVLQGEGITLILDGHTQIKNDVTYSRFESTPDAPFTSFETVLPEGPHSILGVNTEEAPNYDLCAHKITIPTVITAQDGAVMEQDTNVAVTGCGAVKALKAKLTRAQLLAKALKACRKNYKHSKRRRTICEKTAHKKYAAKKKPHKAKRAASRGRRR